MKKIILNSDVIPSEKRNEVELIVKLNFMSQDGIEISYEARGITRALLALPVEILNKVIYTHLRPDGETDGAITDNAVSIFETIDFDIGQVLTKSLSKSI